MKVVLFCGGKGVRLQEDGGINLPKPMVRIGPRPVLWHVMKYYAHFGHTDFILCLGHKAEVIKDYFLHYDETVSNDFTLIDGREVELRRRDLEGWRITFVDTGLESNLGERLSAVRPHLEGEEMFLANYSDGLTDLHLPKMIDQFRASDAVGAFLCTRPQQSFHIVDFDESGRVRRIGPIAEADVWINGGYFVFRQSIFDVLGEGEELVAEPFGRLIDRGALMACRHDGFWFPMDTFKDRLALEQMLEQGTDRWALWKESDRR